MHTPEPFTSSFIRTMTVGIGIAPIHALRLADFTAGGGFHPALKIIINKYCVGFQT